ATSRQGVARAQLGAPALRDLTEAAHDHRNPLAAARAAEHARSLVVQLAAVTSSGRAGVSGDLVRRAARIAGGDDPDRLEQAEKADKLADKVEKSEAPKTPEARPADQRPAKPAPKPEDKRPDPKQAVTAGGSDTSTSNAGGSSKPSSSGGSDKP